jgi:hypothetical protein
MYLTLISWLYITVLCYTAGVAFISFAARVLKAVDRHNTHTLHFTVKCLAGMFFITFLCMLLCIIVPLGLKTNILIFLICTTLFIINRGHLKNSFLSDLQSLKNTHWLIIVLAIGFTWIIASLSFTPSSHYDDGLYYSTSIKWLQQYGTVKGLANINPRIAFNSSWHILQANFGFNFLNIGLLNDMNGLLFILVFFYSLGGVNSMLKGNASVSNAIRALFIMPILAFHFGAQSDIMLFNINFLSSSTPDLPVSMLLWFVFVIFLSEKKIEISKNRFLEDILVVIFGVWAISIKLSAIPIFILCGFLILSFIQIKQYRVLLLTITACTMFCIPWLVRNVLVSGYLIFPFSKIDLFNVEWKLPIQHAQWHENAVLTFILGGDLNKPFNTPFLEWFPVWFAKLVFIKQVILATVFLATFFLSILFMFKLAKCRDYFLNKKKREIVFVSTCILAVAFWLIKGPDFRFGYSFLLVYALFFIVVTAQYFFENRLTFLYIPIISYAVLIGIIYYKGMWNAPLLKLVSKPINYRVPETTKTVTLKNKIKLRLVSYGNSWNEVLPVANEEEYGSISPQLIGETIEEGFKAGKQ